MTIIQLTVSQIKIYEGTFELITSEYQKIIPISYEILARNNLFSYFVFNEVSLINSSGIPFSMSKKTISDHAPTPRLSENTTTQANLMCIVQ